jgi:hypothetical protein
MASQWPVEVRRRAKVATTPERAIAVKMPAAISDRLDSLIRKLEVVREADGERIVERGTSRKELIAALIYDAPTGGRKLHEKLDRYRRAKVASTILRPAEGDQVSLRGHRPGPRPTSLEDPD